MKAVKNRVTGSWLFVDVVAGQLVQRVYYGYTKRQAEKMFRQECREIGYNQIGENNDADTRICGYSQRVQWAMG